MAHSQVAELHLDERLEKSREVIGERVAAGQAKVSTAYNKLWADIEAMRKAQRERQEEQRAAAEKLRLEQEKEGKVPEPAGKCGVDQEWNLLQQANVLYRENTSTGSW